MKRFSIFTMISAFIFLLNIKASASDTCVFFNYEPSPIINIIPEIPTTGIQQDTLIFLFVLIPFLLLDLILAIVIAHKNKK